jgi:AcrR family transcriptional regulator
MPDSSTTSSRPFRGQSRDERVQQRREQLLAAGLQTFGTRGFHATGVREICAQAKLTERYFYESFKNREALFIAVYEQAVRTMHEDIGRALADAPPDVLEIARRGLRVSLETFRDDPRVARLLLIEVLSAGASDASMKVSQSFADLIAELALAISPELTQRGYDVRSIANGLYGSTVYIAMRWTLNGFDQAVDDVLDHCLLFYSGVMSAADKLPHAAQPTARNAQPPAALVKKPETAKKKLQNKRSGSSAGSDRAARRAPRGKP